jgi:non-ribosomal peptide synthetase-like protein
MPFHLFAVFSGGQNEPSARSTASNSELLQEIFEHQARVRPGQIAVVCGEARLTYAELDQRANRLARYLRSQGIGRGDCVAFLLPRSLDVYVAILGILKAGAAYVPLEPAYPPERIRFILQDCLAKALVTVQVFRERLEPARSDSTLNNGATRFLPSHVCLDEPGLDLSRFPAEPLSAAEMGSVPSDLCYIIYTSGTTGRPKGVEIEHRSVCHLVRTEAKLFQVQPHDRVYQGFSPAFDASVEEIWLAFCAGATLVAGTQEMVHAGPELSRMLSKAKVSVLSCVPTLLAMMDEDVPSIQLLIFGGEVCPADLVKRWSKPGRRIFNTYGPTETTVIATAGECKPNQPITIGKPIPGYSAILLDEKLELVRGEMAGELCLGGEGLARGYLGRPELTREKFIHVKGERFYRTGDLARWTPGGELEFLGRLDGQVKIRGFRVELSEIESVLMEEATVKAAAVNVREELPGVQQLVAYVVPRAGEAMDKSGIRARLQARLPSYMVPSRLELLATLPTLPSGKVDRKALPPPREPDAAPGVPIAEAHTALERQLMAEWQALFPGVPISPRDDFFLDLGGHSLLAARMVSRLRKTSAFSALSMLDVYQNPTISSLAARFELLENAGTKGQYAEPPPAASPDGEAAEPAPDTVPFLRHFLCGMAQLVSLVFILGFFALQWLAPYLAYTILIEEEFDVPAAIMCALASLILIYPLMLIIPIVIKWLVIGRYKPGAYPLWGVYYFRWWLVTTIETAVPVGYMSGTPLLNIYLRMMGARIGRNAHLDSDGFAIYDLLEIGEDSSINVDSKLLGYTVEDGYLKVGKITIGKRCFVGTRAAMRENTTLEDDAGLEDLSLLPRGMTVPRGETWSGSPATRVSVAAERCGSKPQVQPQSDGFNISKHGGRLARFGLGLLQAVGLLLFPVLVVLPLFPGIVVMNVLNYSDEYYWYLFLSPMVALSFVVLLCLEIAAVKWLLLGKVHAGRYRLNSLFYFRKWFVDQTMDLSLDILGPLYASIYLAPWYKLLGAKIGNGAEISTASFISPDLLSIGEDSFIADSVSLGAPRVKDGFMKLGRNQIGRRSFIGNSAMLPPGTVIGDSVLVGCLSAPPAKPRDALREDSAWLGSPAMFLPQRQSSTGFGEAATFDPPARLRALRAAVEFIRVIAPSTGFIILLSLLFSGLLLLRDSYSLVSTLAFFPLLYLGCGLAAVLVTIIAKWTLVGRYQAGEKPLWCSFVWRNELVNALHEHLAEPFLVGALTGTPFLCWYFRLLGARIGRRVYMETTDFSEFDLVRIRDEAALNSDCTVQTHLFEDRVMKISTIEIGSRCKVGAGSLVLYDTRMEEGSSLDDLSLLMKGEVLPAGTGWHGIPAVCRAGVGVRPSSGAGPRCVDGTRVGGPKGRKDAAPLADETSAATSRVAE